MMLWFTAIHALAYFPSAMFGGFGEVIGAFRGRVSHAFEHWRDYQYCAAIIVVTLVLYPFIIFFVLIYDGFNPYDELTHAEMKLEGGLATDLVYMFRIILHLYLLIVTIYLCIMLFVLYCIRHF